jgi:hypothetical protein
MHHNYARRFCLLSRALFFAALSFYFSLTAQGQDSTPISKPPLGQWKALLELTASVPQLFDDYQLSLTTRINSLQSINQSLQRNNLNLANSNQSLTESLRLLKTDLVDSEEKSRLLQIQLAESISSITQAKIDAKILEAHLSGWKIAGCVGIAAGIAGIVYGLTR